MPNRQWKQIESSFREVFLTGLGLLEDVKDTVKIEAYVLVKNLKKITLRFANIYTNSDLEELESVLNLTIPMVLDVCMKSTIEQVKFFGADLLYDIVKTSKQDTGVAARLKIKSKEERQLTFSRNSEVKMREIMNRYLDRIILEIVSNFSSFSKDMQTLNYLETLVGENQKGVGKKEV